MRSLTSLVILLAVAALAVSVTFAQTPAPSAAPAEAPAASAAPAEPAKPAEPAAPAAEKKLSKAQEAAKAAYETAKPEAEKLVADLKACVPSMAEKTKREKKHKKSMDYTIVDLEKNIAGAAKHFDKGQFIKAKHKIQNVVDTAKRKLAQCEKAKGAAEAPASAAPAEAPAASAAPTPAPSAK
ncbi:MAG: hypothetical protein HY815_25800 [Candidatus Riflebacteria bacterium]|nr:hypothetical protein [Candidatus Riflebacteria bacterium]